MRYLIKCFDKQTKDSVASVMVNKDEFIEVLKELQEEFEVKAYVLSDE